MTKIVAFPVYAIAMSVFALATCVLIVGCTFVLALVGSVQWCLTQYGCETGENTWVTWKGILCKLFKNNAAT